MEWFSKIIENPLYIFLFGGGGILVIVLALITLRDKEKKEININIGLDSIASKDGSLQKTTKRKYNMEFETLPVIDKHEDYDELEFNTDEFYEAYLKTVEEKRKGGDIIDYK